MRSKITFAILFFVISFGSIAFAQPVAEHDSLKIVYFGSSVPYGFGATKDYGYTYKFNDILKNRAADGTGKNWKTTNISKGGDNTVRLMARWKKDLMPQKGKYVVYALSLGNEGIHESGKPKLDQFKANMTKLIAMARDSGYVPVLTNCYTRNDFTDTDYGFVKDLNLWINSLDVPSVNLLGAVDNGTGKWATGYWHDPGHPNDRGHQEMAYTIVPSLFDALSSGKPQPKLIEGSYLTIGKSQPKSVSFKPDNIVHPFTTTITIKADSKGQIIQLKDSLSRVGSIVITDNGTLEYTSPLYQQITGTTKITDGQPHKITLTHYYARNITQLYCDSTLQGSVAEQLSIKQLYVGNNSSKNILVKNWLFYRAGMNLSEIAALSNDKLLQSSLELYTPLNGEAEGALVNLAQSTNILGWVN
jgi:lysophospholipase L1-like esterase